MLKDITALSSRYGAGVSSMGDKGKFRNAYDTNFKHKLMTGAQAACVYFGPAARNPLQQIKQGVTAKINMKPPQLAY